jgi:predicted small metal-binding protein
MVLTKIGELIRHVLSFRCMASIICRDIGFDCSFEVTGATERDTVRRFIEHTESAHNIPVLNANAMYRIKKRLKK